MALHHNAYSGMTLKALLENPDLQHAPASLRGGPISKDKKASSGGSAGEIDFTSAFLGPQLWDKTYNEDDFNLEYMDLDEFLSENGIPVVETPGLDQLLNSPIPSPPTPSLPTEQSQASAVQDAPSLVIQPSPTSVPVAPVLTVNVLDPGSFLVKTEGEKTEKAVVKQEAVSSPPDAAPTGSTPPASPLPVQVEFTLSEQDIALSSVPGQAIFNPAAHCFTEDELKPQPMIKKSKKVYVPEDMKDEKYWDRRKKNNFAAKRSRDARRVKENQIAMRAAYLEKENSTLKDELDKIRRENVRLKHRLSKYESASSS